ncbi:MAG: hypothetical protein JNK05_11300 [Myxococcales bacterium]|nr:hypothetical protein [Myxococcales bacterium]
MRPAVVLVAALVANVSLLSCSQPPTMTPTNEYRRPTLRPRELLYETPEFVIEPGGDKLFCHYLPATISGDADQLVAEIHSFQMRYGHHVSLNYTTEPGPVLSRECTEQDMTKALLVGAGNESAELMFQLPPGIVVRIPRGAQVILQSHYINPTGAPMRVRDAITAMPPPEGASVQIADPLAMNDSDFMIPPRTNGYGRTLECEIDREMNVVNLFGHAHEWTTRLKIEHAPAGSSAFTSIYDELGTGARLMNSPPMRYFDVAGALRWRPGDRVRLSCDWNNTEDHPLAFPEEMCAAVFYSFPGAGFRTCGRVIETRGNRNTDAGIPSTDGNVGCSTPPAPGDPCVRPCNTGNELGVGRYCTRGGDQCLINQRNRLPAFLCSADFDSTQTTGWCIRPCSDDSACGSGARCVGDARGRGCVPIACVGPEPTDGGADSAADAASSDASTGGSMDASMDR